VKNKYVLFILFILILMSCKHSNEDKIFEGNKSIIQKFPIIESYKKSGIHLINGSSKSFSKLGGLPFLPSTVTWPKWKDKPLSFIGQIKFSELPILEGNYSPTKGLIYIFYDQKQSTWGFDPNDKESWKIIFIGNENTPILEFKKPIGLDIIFTEKHLTGKIINTYPSWDNEKIIKLNFDDFQFEDYLKFIENQFNENPQHLLFGIPTPIQNDDMEYECELVTNGLYLGDSTGYDDPKAKSLKLKKDDWILLFQIDTDNESQMMWGDVGMLYFWIKIEDLKNRKFDNIWMILQCS